MTARDEAAPPFVLALDVGTSSVRASVFDTRAREVAGASARVERDFVKTPGGGHELDADELVETVARAIDAALARTSAEISARIETIATACFWHSLVGVGGEGEAVTPVYGWADTRASVEAEQLAQTQDERAAHLRTGCSFHPSYWPAKLLWLRVRRLELFRAATRWLSFGEYLLARLCGTRAARASVSMASGTGLLDVRACSWDAPLLSILNLDERSLPALAGDDETFRLSDEWAARWPPLRAARVFPAIGDGAANNIGEGCVTRSTAALMVGTSAAMRVAYEGEPPAEFARALWCYRVDRRRVVLGGALSDGGGLREWMTRTLALGVDEDAALARTDADAHGLTVLPFWSGERSTGWHARARGAIVGLGTHTRPEEILRASLEAVAYRTARVAEALDAHAPGASVRASGGALRASPLWTQLFADVLARPLVVSRVREASSRGAVLLALEAMGAIQSVSDAAPTPGLRFEPDAARTDVYRRALERQERLYEQLVGDGRAADGVTNPNS